MKGYKMKVVLPTKFQSFCMEIKRDLNKGLNIYKRLSLRRIIDDFNDQLINQNEMELMFRYDFTGDYIERVIRIVDNIATVRLVNGNEINIKTNETISVIERNDGVL